MLPVVVVAFAIAVARLSCYEFHIWWLYVDCVTFVYTHTYHWTHALAMLSFIIIMNTIWRIDEQKTKGHFYCQLEKCSFRSKLLQQQQQEQQISLSISFFHFVNHLSMANKIQRNGEKKCWITLSMWQITCTGVFNTNAYMHAAVHCSNT